MGIIQDNIDEGKDRYFGSEDTNFQSGDSPVVLDVAGSLGVPLVDGWLKNLPHASKGDVLVEFSMDGSTYGDQFTMKYLETIPLRGFKIKKIRLTHSGTDAGYRLLAR